MSEAATAEDVADTAAAEPADTSPADGALIDARPTEDSPKQPSEGVKEEKQSVGAVASAKSPSAKSSLAKSAKSLAEVAASEASAAIRFKVNAAKEITSENSARGLDSSTKLKESVAVLDAVVNEKPMHIDFNAADLGPPLENVHARADSIMEYLRKNFEKPLQNSFTKLTRERPKEPRKLLKAMFAETEYAGGEPTPVAEVRTLPVRHYLHSEVLSSLIHPLNVVLDTKPDAPVKAAAESL